MTRVYALQVRLTRDQLNCVKESARQRGFPNIATFVRHRILDHSRWLEEILRDMHHLLKRHCRRESRRNLPCSLRRQR